MIVVVVVIIIIDNVQNNGNNRMTTQSEQETSPGSAHLESFSKYPCGMFSLFQISGLSCQELLAHHVLVVAHSMMMDQDSKATQLLICCYNHEKDVQESKPG